MRLGFSDPDYFCFWWESRNYSSYLFQNSFFLHIPLLLLFFTCLVTVVLRRVKDAAFNALDVCCFLALPALAGFVLALLYGFFGEPPKWL